MRPVAMRRGRMVTCSSVVIAFAMLLVTCGPMGSGMMGGDHRNSPPMTTPMPTSTPGGAATVSYQQDIKPILAQHCVSCHGGEVGLWLDSYERILVGGNNGPVVVPADPEQSELYRRITGQSQPEMPPSGGSLSQRDIETIQTWISEGAPNN